MFRLEHNHWLVRAGFQLQSANLWMNFRPSRSSIHYDVGHNLLCLVTGVKRVRVWPPCSTPALTPHSILGESGNHSRVSLDDEAAISKVCRLAGDRHFDVLLQVIYHLQRFCIQNQISDFLVTLT